MFDVRVVTPPGFGKLAEGKFRVRGEFRMVHRYGSTNGEWRQEEEFQHEITLKALRKLEVLPFQGRIGIAVREGSVFIYGDIEAWNQDAQFRIDYALMELEVFLAQFARRNPGFRETIAVSFFPEVLPLH